MIRDMPLVAGLLVGLSIAVPIGPMGLLCIQRTLACGMRIGVCTGLGAVTVNLGFGAAVLLGLDHMPVWITADRQVLSVIAGIFLLWSAARTLMRRRLPGEGAAPRQSPLTAYLSAVAFNATNPMALVLILALLSPLAAGPAGAGAAAGAGASAASAGGMALLLLGMALAAMAWWVCLSGGVTLLRQRLRPELLYYLNQAAGMWLTIYGTLVLARAQGI